MHVHSRTKDLACLPTRFAYHICFEKEALALKNDIFSGSLRLLLRVIFWLCFFKTFFGNYIYSLVDAKYARDIQPLSMEPIVVANFKRFFFLLFKKQAKCIMIHITTRS